jgi:hypothetical protein
MPNIMPGQVCFDSSMFYTVMTAGILVIVFVIYQLYNEKVRQYETSGSAEPGSVGLENNDPEPPIWAQRLLAAQQSQHAEDIQRMVNPLIPPVRRSDYGLRGDIPMVPINIPTRGEYGPFQQVGYLYDPENPKQTMPLMGRRLHSNQFEYYTTNHYNTNVKIPIRIKGDKELDDGGTLPLEGYKNDFVIKLYELDAPRYIPY